MAGILSCTPNTEEGERSSGTIDTPNNQEADQAGQPGADSTAGGSSVTPADNAQENQGNQTSPTGAQ